MPHTPPPTPVVRDGLWTAAMALPAWRSLLPSPVSPGARFDVRCMPGPPDAALLAGLAFMAEPSTASA